MKNLMKTVVVSVMLLVMLVTIVTLISGGTENGGESETVEVVMEGGTSVDAERTRWESVTGPRKLLNRFEPTAAPAGSASAEVAKFQPTRIWGDKCSTSDIVITQGPSDPLPSGIPTYTVEIMNVCTSGCNISGIHISCGWFSSARLINPHQFKRMRYNDCLVNGGKPLVNGRMVTFQYANTFPYPLTVSSIMC